LARALGVTGDRMGPALGAPVLALACGRLTACETCTRAMG
jgi:hypothetical protein